MYVCIFKKQTHSQNNTIAHTYIYIYVCVYIYIYMDIYMLVRKLFFLARASPIPSPEDLPALLRITKTAILPRDRDKVLGLLARGFHFSFMFISPKRLNPKPLVNPQPYLDPSTLNS